MSRTVKIIMWILVGLLAVVAGLVVVVVIANYRFNNNVKTEVEQMYRDSQQPEYAFSAASITHLPSPVQRYLTRSIPEGHPLIETARLRQVGSMRQGPDQAWFPFAAEQHFTTQPPAFVWNARMKMMPMLTVAARDKYIDGQGQMTIQLQATVPIANGEGLNYDTGAFIRYMAEMMWFPTAMLADYVQWEAVDEHTAVAVSTVGDEDVRVVFHFNEDGDIAYIESHDRHMGDDPHTTPWYGYCSDYQTLAGVRIPTSVEVGWEPDSGYYAWWRGTVTEIEYDVPKAY